MSDGSQREAGRPSSPAEASSATSSTQGALGSWGGWLSSVVEVAKEKSSQAVDLLKSDFNEFQQETSRVLSGCTAVVQDKLRPENRQAAGQRLQEGVTKLWGDFSTMMYTPPDEEDDDIAITAPTNSRFQSRLQALQCDVSTYSTEPGEPEPYETWRAGCDLEQRKQAISDLLVHRHEVRTLYTRLVPSSVSHADFWHRYFYKVHQLEQEESRKLELIRRADLAKVNMHAVSDWDETNCHVNESPCTENVSAGVAVPLLSKSDGMKQVALQTASHTEGSPPTPAVLPAVSKEEIKSQDTLQDASLADKEAKLTSTESEKTCVESVGAETKAVELASSGDERGHPEKSFLNPLQTAEKVEKELKVKDRGDVVVVGSSTPSADSSSSNKQDDEEDWEKEFDIEVTEEDMAIAEKAAAKIASGQEDPEDWENW